MVFYISLLRINILKYFIMNSFFQNITIASSGVVGQEIVKNAFQFDPTPITQGVGIISQIVILLVSLVGLFKTFKAPKLKNK